MSQRQKSLLSLIYLILFCSNGKVLHVSEARPIGSGGMELELETNPPWNGFEFIFVGGLHYSGTSITERLLSTQPWATGFVKGGTVKSNLKQCSRPHCLAPEREGIFFTQAFNKYIFSKCVLDTFGVGGCNWKEHSSVANNFLETSPRSELYAMKSLLWEHWSKFWVDCRSKSQSKYLIEKDIPNIYHGRLLQSLFGEEITSFVFVLRHPLTKCFFASKRAKVGNGGFDYQLSDNTCGTKQLQFWLDNQKITFENIKKLRRVVVFQLEKLIQSPELVLDEVARLILPYSSNGGGGATTHLKFNFKRMNTDEETSRRLNYHPESDGEIVTIAGSFKHLKEKEYSDYVNGSGTFLFASTKRRQAAKLVLKPFDAKLRVYCYSVYSLEPISGDVGSICTEPVVLFKKTMPHSTVPPNTSSRKLAQTTEEDDDEEEDDDDDEEEEVPLIDKVGRCQWKNVVDLKLVRGKGGKVKRRSDASPSVLGGGRGDMAGSMKGMRKQFLLDHRKKRLDVGDAERVWKEER
jgi:hypothetical protein